MQGSSASPPQLNKNYLEEVSSEIVKRKSSGSFSESEVDMPNMVEVSEPAPHLGQKIEDALAAMQEDLLEPKDKTALSAETVKGEIQGFLSMETNGLAYEEGKRLSKQMDENPKFFTQFKLDNPDMMRQIMVKLRNMDEMSEQGALKPNPDEIQQTQEKDAAMLERKNEKRLQHHMNAFESLSNSSQPNAKQDALLEAKKVLTHLKANPQLEKKFEAKILEFNQKVADIAQQVKAERKIQSNVDSVIKSAGRNVAFFTSKKAELTNFFNAVNNNDFEEAQKIEKKLSPHFQLKLELNLMEFSKCVKNIDRPGERDRAATLATTISLLLKRFPSEEAKLQFLEDHPGFKSDFEAYRNG